MTEPDAPFKHLVDTAERVCGPRDRPNLAARAKLRRALRHKSLMTLDALTVIGDAIGDHDPRRIIEAKIGVCALYAAHGQPAASVIWTTPAALLAEAKASNSTKASNSISADRAGRELIGLLREHDPASLVRRCNRVLTMCAKAAGVDTARTDWGRLFADIVNLTGDDPDRRARVETRWARDFARLPAPQPSTTPDAGRQPAQAT